MSALSCIPEDIPSVVVSSKGATLGDKLDLRNLPLATTPGGRAFAIKSLHPSDHEFKVVRGPGSTVPTLGICSDQVETIAFPAGCERAVVVQTPNPWVPAQLRFVDALGADIDVYTFRNPSLGGSTLSGNDALSLITAGAEMISQNFQRMRVLAQSITAELIAPALADQGTIVSAQFVAHPRKMESYIANSGSGPDYPVTNFNLRPRLLVYDPAPAVSTLLTGTSAYTSKAREGFYQPLKISCFKWRNANDGFIPMTGQNDYVNIFGPNAQTLPSVFPYKLKVVGENAATCAMPLNQSDIVGISYMEGVSSTQQVAIRLRIRQVIEVVPYPGTQYASLCEAPLPPDDTSYRMIAEISGRMADAYPSSYNDLGKLKNVITTIGKALLPVVDPVLSIIGSVIPGAGPVATIARGMIGAGKSIASSDVFKKSLKTTDQLIAELKAKNGQIDRLNRGMAAIASRAAGPGKKSRRAARRKKKNAKALVVYRAPK